MEQRMNIFFYSDGKENEYSSSVDRPTDTQRVFSGKQGWVVCKRTPHKDWHGLYVWKGWHCTTCTTCTTTPMVLSLLRVPFLSFWRPGYWSLEFTFGLKDDLGGKQGDWGLCYFINQAVKKSSLYERTDRKVLYFMTHKKSISIPCELCRGMFWKGESRPQN